LPPLKHVPSLFFAIRRRFQIEKIVGQVFADLGETLVIDQDELAGRE
jgi:hypothetical protein